MEQVGNLNTIYEYMSARLRGNKELAMLDLQEDFPNTEYYSSKLRNDDEIAATLFRLYGADSWAWHYMSKRLKKNIRQKKDRGVVNEKDELYANRISFLYIMGDVLRILD